MIHRAPMWLFRSHTVRMPAPLLQLALAALALVLPCSCGRKAPEPGASDMIRVAILADNNVNPMRNYQATLLEKLIRTRPRMEAATVHAGGDAEVQLRQVREAVQAHAAFIMVFPQDAGKLTPALREAMATGVRVFAFSADVPEDACTCALFTDERQLGQMAGEYIVSALKTKAQAEGQSVPTGRVVVLRGDEVSTASQESAEGFLKAIQPFPGIVLVHDAPADWSEKGGADRIREALRIQKRFDVIYAQNDLVALGASKAVRESSADARETMLILGTDGVPGKGAGIAMVISGELDATVYHPPLVDAAWPVMQSILDNAGVILRKRIQVKPFIITPENAARVQQAGLPVPDTQ